MGFLQYLPGNHCKPINCWRDGRVGVFGQEGVALCVDDRVTTQQPLLSVVIPRERPSLTSIIHPFSNHHVVSLSD